MSVAQVEISRFSLDLVHDHLDTFDRRWYRSTDCSMIEMEQPNMPPVVITNYMFCKLVYKCASLLRHSGRNPRVVAKTVLFDRNFKIVHTKSTNRIDVWARPKNGYFTKRITLDTIQVEFLMEELLSDENEKYFMWFS